MTRRCFAIVLACGAAIAAEYRIAPEPGSQFKLEVHKTGAMSGKVHAFTFERYTGTLVYQDDAPERSRVEFTVEAKSIVCRDTWVDEKDKTKIVELAHKMMEAEKHPQLRFVSDSVGKRADGAFEVRGQLSIKGVAKPSVVMVTLQKERNGLRLKGKATVLRKDYKIDPPSPLPFGIIGNKQEMPVEFSVLALP